MDQGAPWWSRVRESVAGLVEALRRRRGAGHRVGRAGPDLATVRLEQAFQQEGCPVCRLAHEMEDRSFWILLWENVNDPGIRGEIRAALGFCPAHWIRLDLVGRRSGLGVLGQAIIAEDLLLTLAESLEKALARRSPASALTSRRSCPACARREEATAGYLAAVERWADAPSFWAAYQRSDGLCLQHIARLDRNRWRNEAHRRLHLLGPLLARRPVEGWLQLEGFFWGWPLTSWGAPGTDWCCICHEERGVEGESLSELGPGLPCPGHGARMRALGMTDSLADRYREAVEAAEAELVGAVGRDGWTAASVLADCPICREVRRAGEEALRRGTHLAEAAALCLGHLRLALLLPGAEEVAERHVGQLRELAGSLRDFIRKADWNHRHEPRGQEQYSWPRSLSFLAGGATVKAPRHRTTSRGGGLCPRW